MKLLEFLTRFKLTPAFSTRSIELVYPHFERENLLNWQKKGYIVRIRNGWYSVSGRITTERHLYWVANKIYHPSYVSLETAFAFYGWIPEAVFTTTSVSTLKTRVFDTPVGCFRYSSLNPKHFWGYRLIKTDDLGIKMAEPEKALLDFLYLHPKLETKVDFEALRFNTDQMRGQIDREKLLAYNKQFDSVALNKRVFSFTNFIYYDESV